MPEETPTWTVEEAREYLPRLRGLIAILRRATELASLARGNGHSKLRTGPTLVSGHDRSEDHGDVGPVETSEDDQDDGDDQDDQDEDLLWGVSPRQAMDELAERGIILRDPSRGLIDFPSRAPSGRAVLLCWQYGEDDLTWWHLPEDGFAGRRPLPVPPDI